MGDIGGNTALFYMLTMAFIHVASNTCTAQSAASCSVLSVLRAGGRDTGNTPP